MLLVIIGEFYLMQNPKPGIGFVSNVIPEVPAQLLINLLGLTICLRLIVYTWSP